MRTHRSEDVALQLLPQVEGLEELERSLERGLLDESDAVAAAAASVVGRMRVVGLAPLLEACLSRPNTDAPAGGGDRS